MYCMRSTNLSFNSGGCSGHYPYRNSKWLRSMQKLTHFYFSFISSVSAVCMCCSPCHIKIRFTPIYCASIALMFMYIKWYADDDICIPTQIRFQITFFCCLHSNIKFKICCVNFQSSSFQLMLHKSVLSHACIAYSR